MNGIVSNGSMVSPVTRCGKDDIRGMGLRERVQDALIDVTVCLGLGTA
jgi:hypothetical protein